MFRKKIICLIMIVSIIVVNLLGCSQPNNGNATTSSGANDTVNPNQVYTIKIGHTCALNHPYQIGAEKFKEIVEAKSDGRLKVEIYPSSQLGGERDMVESIQAGTIEMGAVSMGVASGFIEGADIFNLPFVFNGTDHFLEVAHGDIGKKFIQQVSGKNGIKLLSIGYPVFRVPFSGVGPLTTIEDFKGIKIRTMEVPAHMDAYAALGANPTPTASSEQFLAYQMGTLDAGENGVVTIYSEKYYENCPDISMIPVVCGGAFWLFSQKFYDSLPADLQGIIDGSIEEFSKYTDKITLEDDRKLREEIEKNGGHFYDDIDLSPFKEVVAPVLEKYKAEIVPWAVDILEEIQNMEY